MSIRVKLFGFLVLVLSFSLSVFASLSNSSALAELSKYSVPECYKGRGGIYANLNTLFGIPYKYADGELLRFDISYPETKAPLAGYPLIIYFHGGGFVGGERFSGYGYTNEEIRWYNSRGIAVATVTYRLSRFFPKRTMLESLKDGKDAARFIVKHAKELKINPSKMGVYGHSAGAHLTCTTAFSGDGDFVGDESLKGVKVKFVCAVAQASAGDLVDPESDVPGSFISSEATMRCPLGGSLAETVELRELLSPARYLRKGGPAILILQGTEDKIIPKQAAFYLEKKAKALGIPVELVLSEGAGHAFENARKPNNRELDEIRRNFFAKHLLGN